MTSDRNLFFANAQKITAIIIDIIKKLNDIFRSNDGLDQNITFPPRHSREIFSLEQEIS